MWNFSKVYGVTTLQKYTDEDETRTISLKYYKTKDRNFRKDTKQYGVGVIKTEIGSNELNEEKLEVNHICEQKDEVENLLNMLLKNKVTPVDLKYVLEDLE